MSPLPLRRAGTSRVVARTAAAMAVALGLAACSGAAPATQERTGIILGRAMDVTTLDMSRSLCDTCQIYNAAVYESLLRATPDGKLEPLLAEKWEANADNTAVHVHPARRRDVRRRLARSRPRTSSARGSG